MTELEDPKVIDVLLVEDDEGDVLMTREAFEYYKIQNRLHVVGDGEQALQFLRQTRVQSDNTYRTELRYAVADDERAVAVYRAQGEREGRTLDIEQALFCEIRGGQIADVTAVPFDFPAFAAFWA